LTRFNAKLLQYLLEQTHIDALVGIDLTLQCAEQPAGVNQGLLRFAGQNTVGTGCLRNIVKDRCRLRGIYL
jgi:hypothetical protein